MNYARHYTYIMRTLLMVLLLAFFTGKVTGQQTKTEEQRKQFYKVLDLMYQEKYDAALDILYHLDSTSLTPFVENADQRYFYNNGDTVSIEKIYVKYLIAACYFEDRSKTQKPLEYIEFVINSGYSKTPEIVYKDLGDLYHRDYQFDKAVFYYRKFLKETNENDVFYDYVKERIQVSQNAREILKDTIKAPVFELNDNVNTPFSEKHPLITTDHSLLVFDYTEYANSATDQKDVKHYAIKACYKELGVWKKARPIDLQLPKGMSHYRLAGLHPGGKNIYLAIAKDKESPKNLYKGKLNKYSVTGIEPINALSSDADENFITVSKDSQIAYFSSNREGGSGRYDIYKSTRKQNNQWGEPENLGEAINTSFDEINPYLHPQKNLLYFSSNGHKNLGGLDIFVSHLMNNEWQEPKNVGFPINTVVNNYSVSINPRMNKLYFSLEKSRDYTNHDIYTTNLESGVPYTVLNGLVMPDNASESLVATIKVGFLKEGKKDMIITRQPNEDGNYLVFFPPGNEYKMLIRADGYQTRLIKFRVPEQNYFHQIRQKIVIKPIKLFDEKVGEQFELQNYFQDIPDDTSEVTNVNALVRNEEDDKMQEVAERIAEFNKEKNTQEPRDDKYGKLMNFIDQSIERSDTTALRQLKQKTTYDNKVTAKYFYNKEAQTTKRKVKIGDQTFEVDRQIDLTSKALNAREINLNNLVESNTMVSGKEQDTAKTTKKEEPKLLKEWTVYFNNNESVIQSQYHNKLKELAAFLLDNPKLGVRIHGYANDIGREKSNYELSGARARAIKKYLTERKVNPDRIEVQARGEKKTSGKKDIELNRRADIIIFSR